MPATWPKTTSGHGRGPSLTPTASRNIGPRDAAAAGWPYDTAEPRTRAGSPAAFPATGEVRLTLVPYHRWGNRGRATMRVWLPEAASQSTG